MSVLPSLTAVTPAHARTTGILLLLGSGVCFSSAGVFIRLVEAASTWQVVFYRSLAFSLAVLVYMAVRKRGATAAALRDLDRAALIGTLGLAVGVVFLIWAQFHTTIANVVFILGALPFLTGLLAWAFLGEKVARTSWFTMAVALAGIAVMVYGGIVAGKLYGNVLALIAIVGYAVFTLAVRHGRAGDASPILVLGAGLGALVAFIVDPDPAVRVIDLLWSTLMGALSMGVGFILFVHGAKVVRAGEMWLLSNVEIVTGPVLVWLVIGEVPTALTVWGGILVVGAIVVQAVATVREASPADQRPS
jgi:drug/metabolite transporter (DMT)-like permease